MTAAGLRAHYTQQLLNPDPVTRAVAAHQLGQLGASEYRSGGGADYAPSRWRHIPLADLFAAEGNQVYQKSATRAETGHEPAHSSKSGRCVVLFLDEGRWACTACRTSGDALTLLMQRNAWTARQAATHLARTYGAPTERGRRRGRAQMPVLEARR